MYSAKKLSLTPILCLLNARLLLYVYSISIADLYAGLSVLICARAFGKEVLNGVFAGVGLLGLLGLHSAGTGGTWLGFCECVRNVS
jgi:hypothetical protein